MEFVAELEISVILSSHLIGDLERVCDHLVVLAASHVQLTGEVEDLLANHYRLIAARGDLDVLPPGIEAIQAEHTARQTTLVVRDTTGALPHLLDNAEHLAFEDLVLAYLTRAANGPVNSAAEQPLEANR
jgi:ABC-2 type transport system ATP-binding protein